MQYLEPRECTEGETAMLLVSHNTTRVWVEWPSGSQFDREPEAQSTPQQCKWNTTLPTWHMPMVADETRNAAFAAAIERAVAAVKEQRGGSCRVWDLGCGSGLLSMMAHRSGATHVLGIESNQALVDAGLEVLKDNHIPRGRSDGKVRFWGCEGGGAFL